MTKTREERPTYELVKPDDGTWRNRYEGARVTPPIPDRPSQNSEAEDREDDGDALYGRFPCHAQSSPSRTEYQRPSTNGVAEDAIRIHKSQPESPGAAESIIDE